MQNLQFQAIMLQSETKIFRRIQRNDNMSTSGITRVLNSSRYFSCIWPRDFAMLPRYQMKYENMATTGM